MIIEISLDQEKPYLHANMHIIKVSELGVAIFYSEAIHVLAATTCSILQELNAETWR